LYALLQIPTGMIFDRFGVTSVYRVTAFLWSLASTGSVFAGIRAMRLVLGVAEGPAFPRECQGDRLLVSARRAGDGDVDLRCRSKIRQRHRGSAGRISGRADRVAVGFHHYRLAELSLFLAFLIVYRDPSRHPRLSPAELEYIRSSGATRDGPAESGEVAMLSCVLSNRKVRG
jgi:hypothetical protein